jgi:hypothetical protein
MYAYCSFHFFAFTYEKILVYVCGHQCKGLATMGEVYPVTSRFILDQGIVAFKEMEHCFHICAAVCTGIRLVMSCLVQAMSPPKFLECS